MKKISEIQNELQSAMAEMKAATEPEARSAAGAKVAALTKELNEANILDAAERAAAANKITEKEKNEVQQFSFTRFMRGLLDNKLAGFEAEMAEEARNEARNAGVTLKGGAAIPYIILANKRAAAGQNVATPAAGGNLVQESPLVYVDTLRHKLILNDVGATGLTGLVGDLPLVRGSQFEGKWYGENEQVTETKKMNFTKQVMKSKRLAIKGAYSRQLLLQSSVDVERLIMDELINAHALSLNRAIICGTGESGEPMGILNTVGIGAVIGGTNGANMNWANLVGLETAVAVANADLGNLAYLTNTKVRGQLKITEKSNGTARYLMENGEVNGYKLLATNLVPSDLTKGTGTELSAAIFGNFADVVWGQWAGLDILLDPYTLADQGDIKVIATAFHDIAVKNVESFAAMKDIITD